MVELIFLLNMDIFLQRGEISNFQYLMHLNTLAGRSYNDLMQYPIFPWILADYDSEELDLTDSSTFRDFSKSMGAQSPERLSQFKKRYRKCSDILQERHVFKMIILFCRYKEWDDPHGETPPYHYGTHYSSAMIVCSYLVRMEPFTQHFLRLQVCIESTVVYLSVSIFICVIIAIFRRVDILI